ncbi:benzoate 1,2-dioxygenase electron transfer component BenC [Pandoraea pnomenusa]|uniref:benzoate 1,2-dioxygenase electron transfer component BenC n=1 Tax=Pandoraea pnomenusa TaxID=93220 RepID=UPI00334065A7
MKHNVALQFEDGVTRIIQCDAHEPVCDAAYRARINIPLDCRDGACGTCKSHCESGTYTLGAYIEDALAGDEAASGYVLTCQMRVTSDCVIRIPVTSDACKVEVAEYEGRLAQIVRDSPTTMSFSLETAQPLSFLPGQYVNLKVPASEAARSYSFSSAPERAKLSFLIRDVPNGAMSAFMRQQAKPGDVMTFTGPYGSFYLRPVVRPVLMLAGGTGLAPFLSMLTWLNAHPCAHPIRLAYGVNTVADLVELSALDTLKAELPDFDYVTCVADRDSDHPRLGYVTDHLQPTDLHDGNVDVYVCGPPPMVDGIRQWMSGAGVIPANFHFEKFSSTAQGQAA